MSSGKMIKVEVNARNFMWEVSQENLNAANM